METIEAVKHEGNEEHGHLVMVTVDAVEKEIALRAKL